MESCFKWLIDVGVRVTSQIEWLDSVVLLQPYMSSFTYLVSVLNEIPRGVIAVACVMALTRGDVKKLWS